MSEETTVGDLEPGAACYYDRLGLDPRVDDPATEAEKVYHDADRLQREGDLSPKEFTRVREARDFLRDDDDREAYDTFLERFGRDAGTEAFHTWDDQGRPSSPASWTPPSQSSDDGPDSGRTPETDDEDDRQRRRNRDDTDTRRTPNQERRQQRQRARQQERQSGRDRQTTTRDTGARTTERQQTRQEERQSSRDRQTTTRDSGARTSERQSRDSRTERENGRQRGEQRQRSQPDRTDEVSGGPSAVEAATATKYRVGYLLCALGGVATVGLLAGMAVDAFSGQTGVGLFGLTFIATGIGLSYVTSGWTDAVEDTSDPDDVYDSVLLRPGLVKRAALAGIGLAFVQALIGGVAPQVVLQLIGVVSVVGFFFLPLAYGFTQVYNVTFGNLGS